MSQTPMLNSWDEAMLKSMGISPVTPDAHNECMVRWMHAPETEAADRSQPMNYDLNRAYERLDRAILEAEVWKWERRCWRLAFILAIVCSWLLVMVFRR